MVTPVSETATQVLGLILCNSAVPEGSPLSRQEYLTICNRLRVDAYPITAIDDDSFSKGEFRTHCKCCGSLMPRTEDKLNTCEHCGATQNTFDNT